MADGKEGPSTTLPPPPESTPIHLQPRRSPHVPSKTTLSSKDRSSSFSKTPVLRTTKNVKTTLSRPYYQPGSAVVGTIRVLDEGGGEMTWKTWKSVSLFMVGYCRLDNRWHKRTSNYANTYSMHYPSHQNEQEVDNDNVDEQFLFDRKRLPRDFPDLDSVFWSAAPQGVDLVRVADTQSSPRQSWEHARPQPIKYTENWAEQPESLTTASNQAPFAAAADGARHASAQSFTFRANLPKNLPGTLSLAMSCRYSYNLLLRLQSHSGAVTWVETPVLVQRLQQQQAPALMISKNHPALSVKCHTGGLPCSLTPTELFEASPEYQKGALTVHRFSAAFHGGSTPGPVLRISDPQHQQHVAVLTLLVPFEASEEASAGSTRVSLCPGSRLILQFDFPNKDNVQSLSSPKANITTANDEDSWVPCYQVSCCLQGSESVLSYDIASSPRGETKSMLQQQQPHRGSLHQTADTNTMFKQKRHCAQQMLLSTAHQTIDPESTQRVSLSLLVPDNTICSTHTPTMEISYECVVDIVVASPPPPAPSSKSTSTKQMQQRLYQPKYRNLRLQVPCTIAHAPTALETMAHEMKDPEEVALLQRQRMLWNERNKQARTDAGLEVDLNGDIAFPSGDIEDDLKRLSIFTAEENGWTQAPP